MKKLIPLLLIPVLSAFLWGGAESTTTCSAITGTYAATTAFTPRARSVWVQNSCNQKVILSTDGTTDRITIPIGMSGAWEFPPSQSDTPAGTIYVKHAGAAPSSGELVITVNN